VDKLQFLVLINCNVQLQTDATKYGERKDRDMLYNIVDDNMSSKALNIEQKLQLSK